MKSVELKKQNLILDLDGTLIDAQSPCGASSALVLGRGAPAHCCGARLGHLRIFKRPGLEMFLDWCFKNFDNVGIWTLSSQEWLNEVLENVLTRYPKEKWSLLWTSERATRVQGKRRYDAVPMGEHYVLKDLKKVFNNKDLRRKGFARWNTLIVEDTPSNCSRNYGNSVYVSPFDILAKHRDHELYHLKTYFQKTLSLCSNVRCIDKRTWLREVLMAAAAAEEKEKQMKTQGSDTKKSDAVAFWMSEKWKPPTSLINITSCSIRI